MSESYNPLGLTTLYVWQAGDTLEIVAMKYRRRHQWKELLQHNITQIQRNRYLQKEGDIISIPEEWFPLPEPIAFETRFIGSSTKGEKVYHAAE